MLMTMRSSFTRHRLRSAGASRATSPLLASFFALAFAACEKPAPAAFERPPAPVSVAVAIARDVDVYLDEIGRCVAYEVVSIQPQVSGRITAIHFVDGADVKQGELLFTIDPRPYQAELDSAEAKLSEATAVRDLAKVEFARVETLVNTKAISGQDYDAKKQAVAVADAQVMLVQASIEKARLDLEYCSIRSPINGRAGQRLVDLGNVVNANSGSLLVIQRLDPVYADFTVAENSLTNVQASMRVAPLRVEIRIPDDRGPPLTGQLTFMDNAVQSGTGTVKLRATVPNAEHRLWPGRFVRARLVLRTIPAAVLVPASTPQLSATGSFVYVVKEDSTAELRPVKTGQRHGEWIVIAEGVAPGERVVVEGQLGIVPGGKVHVTRTVPPNADAGGASAESNGLTPETDGAKPASGAEPSRAVSKS